MPEQLNHPTPKELSAFSLGQLPPEQAAAVEAHITECQPCCETLLGVSDEDTFVALLKEADRAPDEATVDLNLTASSGSRKDAAEIPPSLLDHARYRVVGLVGRGGMGDVYKAEHRMMERTVALKVINRDLISKPAAVGRFHREVRAAARLSHPNIVTAYDAEQAGDVHFLAMEFVDGIELSEIVNQRGPLPIGEAVDYIRQAAAGLQHAHEMGMVHRDVKPQNLMLDASGNVKILDFGLANFASESAAEVVGEEAGDSAQPARVRHQLTQLGVMMGTPDYVAPEQAQDARSADIRSDIYSLGCTFYYLLAGEVPFPGDSVLDKLQAHSAGDLRPMHELRSDLPEGLEDVLQKMMAQEPGERFQTPGDVSAALQPYVGAIESKSPLAKSAGAGNRKRFRWIAAAAAAALLCGAIVVITDRGRIEIESGVDDVEIVVSQDGRQVRVLDVASGTSVHWLPSGEYQVAVSGDGTANVTIGPETVTIARFGKEIVHLQSDPADPGAEQKEANLVKNGGFEDAADSKGDQPTYWLAMPKTTPSEPAATCQRDVTDAVSGKAAAMISKDLMENRLAEAGFMQTLSDLPAGKTLRLSGQIKTKDVDGAVAIKLRLLDYSKTISKRFLGMCETPAVDGTSEWRRYEALIQIPKGAVGELALVLQGTGKAWFDDIQLVVIPQPKSLLANGGFDEVANGQPAGWTARGPATGVTMKADDEIVRSGDASATIIYDGDGAEPYNWRQEVTTIHAGDSVSLTGWVKTKDAFMAAVAVQVLDTNGQMIAFHTTQHQTNFRETSDWRSFTLRFSIPKKTARLAVLAMLSGRGQVWFDDFEMKTELSTNPQDR